MSANCNYICRKLAALFSCAGLLFTSNLGIPTAASGCGASAHNACCQLEPTTATCINSNCCQANRSAPIPISQQQRAVDPTAKHSAVLVAILPTAERSLSDSAEQLTAQVDEATDSLVARHVRLQI